MIKLSNVSKNFGDKCVINNVDLNIKEGEVIALVGPNGSGKTTLFNLIMENIQVDNGKIEIMINGDALKNKVGKLSNIGFLQSESVLTKYLSGYDHLKFLANTYKKSEKDIEDIILFFDLKEFIHKKIKHYSLGMKQRLLVSLAVMNNPKILIFDEPFNGIDYENSNKLKNLFETYKKRGCSVIFSSHILSDIDRISDRIIFLKDGIIQKEVINSKREQKDLQLTSTEKYYNEIFGETL